MLGGLWSNSCLRSSLDLLDQAIRGPRLISFKCLICLGVVASSPCQCSLPLSLPFLSSLPCCQSVSLLLPPLSQRADSRGFLLSDFSPLEVALIHFTVTEPAVMGSYPITALLGLSPCQLSFQAVTWSFPSCQLPFHSSHWFLQMVRYC